MSLPTEALRALEKEMRGQALDGPTQDWRPNMVAFADRLAIIATASEQAPVAWVIRDSATEKMVWDFEATVFDSEGDVHEFIGQLKDDDENVEGLEPAAVSFSSPAHTSEARKPDPEKVICPNCCHQFHAISERDQQRMRAHTSEARDAERKRTWAQDLIEQLPVDHDGRNSWLLNFGVGDESDWLRVEHKRYGEAWMRWQQGDPQPERRRYNAAMRQEAGDE